MNLRVALVDDDIDFLGSLAETLRRGGFTVFTAVSGAQARQLLDEQWLHVAVIDVRLVSDDEDDISGIELAREERYRTIPKIILTGYPSWERAREALGPRLDGPPAADDFVVKREGSEALIAAIHKVVNARLGINWSLVPQWGPGLSYLALVLRVDPTLAQSEQVARAEELADLWRMLLTKCAGFGVDRVLWQQPGRVALVVFAHYADAPSRHLVVTCGLKEAILGEKANLDKLTNVRVLNGNLHPVDGRHTLHYAANAYEAPDSDLETIKTFAELFRQENGRAINDALEMLAHTSLNFWHSERSIERDEALEPLLRRRFHLEPPATVAVELAAAIQRISRDAAATGQATIVRSGDVMRIHRPGGIDFAAPDPVAWLEQARPQFAELPVFVAPTVGDLRAETILIDGDGRTWLSNFGELAEGPILADYAALESSIKFDLTEGCELVDRLEGEQLLMAGQRLADRLEAGPQSLRKAMGAIQRARHLAADVVGDAFGPYLLALAYGAIRRIVAYEAGPQPARRDVLPAVHACLSLGVVVARLAKLSAASGEGDGPAGELTVDEGNRQVHLGRRLVALTPAEFNAVHFMWQRAGQLSRRPDLFQAVFGRPYEQGKAVGDDAQLNMLIKRVREALEPDPHAPRYLITLRGEGFFLYPRGKP